LGKLAAAAAHFEISHIADQLGEQSAGAALGAKVSVHSSTGMAAGVISTL
jgi:hypothetical protein